MFLLRLLTKNASRVFRYSAQNLLVPPVLSVKVLITGTPPVDVVDTTGVLADPVGLAVDT